MNNELKNEKEGLDILPPPRWHKTAMTFIIIAFFACIIAGSVFTVVSISQGGPDSPDRVINRLEEYINTGNESALKDILPKEYKKSSEYVADFAKHRQSVDETQSYKLKITERRTYTSKEIDSGTKAIRKAYRQMSGIFNDFDYQSDVGYITNAEYLKVNVTSITKPEYRPTPTPKPTKEPTPEPTIEPTELPEGVIPPVTELPEETPVITEAPRAEPTAEPEKKKEDFTTDLGEFEIVVFKVDGNWCIEHLVY